MSSQTHWLIEQIARAGKSSPERIAELEKILASKASGVYFDLVIGAVDQEMISVDEAATKTGVSVEIIMAKLKVFRNQGVINEAVIEVDPSRGGAKLIGSGLCVWEVVREFRKSGTIEQLSETFPDVSKTDLLSALAHAEKNPVEIEREISAYEAVVKRRKAEYPCS